MCDKKCEKCTFVKTIIKKIENRIDTFVKEHPEKKDSLEVQTQREFVHMLQIEAKEQAKRKE